MKRRVTWLGGIVAALGVYCASSGQLNAQTNAIANGSWSDAGTWSAGVPNGTTAANVDGGFTVAVDQPGATTNKLDIGNAAGENGAVSVAAGADLTVANDGPLPSIRVGQAAGASGTLTVSGGQVTINGNGGFAVGDLMIGDNGNGTMNMTDGTVAAGDEVVIGTQNTSTSTVNISGGRLDALGRSILVGFSGNATLNVSGTATVRANFDMLTSFLQGSTATINQSGGTIEAGFLFTNFDNNPASTGSTTNINMTGGTFNTRIAYVLGRGRGVTTLTHSDGVINALLGNGDMVVADGAGNTSTYNVSGTASVNTLHNFFVGTGEGAEGTVNQSGGAIAVGDNLFIGRDGVGTWNQSGGTTTAKQVFLGDFDTSKGTLKVTGGALNLSGNLNVGAALASNAPPMPTGTQGQALDAHGVLIVSGAAGDVNVAGNLLANAGDHTRRRPDLTGQNISDLVFEVDAGGVSMIEVAGIADLTGANIDVDLISGSWAPGSSFDLITATSISSDFLQVAEDVGSLSLAVVPGGNGAILRATVVPEPAAALLAAAGVLAVGLSCRGKRA
ncbi:MAG: hypothetical protein IT424_13500 [Pirellulales bacterium]|nr:hypothetical protein [Pirellulales bacterium]